MHFFIKIPSRRYYSVIFNKIYKKPETLKAIKKIGFLVFIFFCGHIEAQNQELLHKYHLLKGDVLLIPDDNARDFSGNEYYRNGFHSALVHFPKNPPLSAQVRYNMEKEEMEVLIEENNYQVLQDGIMVEIDNAFFRKYTYKTENNITSIGYFEVFKKDENQPLTLLKKHYKEAQTDFRSEKRGFPPKYVEKSTFYLKVGKVNPAVLLYGKLKNFLPLLAPETQNEMEFFIKKNKLKVRNQEDLITFVDHYNSLLKK